MPAPLSHLRVVLVRPRFPENIGMTARACANMGVSRLVLIEPERWDVEKARPLATGQGERVLEGAELKASLAEALADAALVLGTTARVGGRRREILVPERAAELAARAGAEEEPVALVFGPEDRGLENEETALCSHLIRIPTAEGASSLNLAQAVLLVLYECFRAAGAAAPAKKGAGAGSASRRARHEEEERLVGAAKDLLLRIDFLHGENPDYFLLPLRRFLARAELRRHEYDMLMGICRQLGHTLKD